MAQKFLLGTLGLGSALVLGHVYSLYAVNIDARAVAVIKGEPGYEQIKEWTEVQIEVSGLSAGKHGVHIHEFGNLTKGCKTTGSHFNPFETEHGDRKDITRHVGDLGNLEVKEDGETVSLTFKNDLIRVFGPTGVVGRAIVIHKDEDDLGRGNFPDSKTTGHAGSRIACGVIGRAK